MGHRAHCNWSHRAVARRPGRRHGESAGGPVGRRAQHHPGGLPRSGSITGDRGRLFTHHSCDLAEREGRYCPWIGPPEEGARGPLCDWSTDFSRPAHRAVRGAVVHTTAGPWNGESRRVARCVRPAPRRRSHRRIRRLARNAGRGRCPRLLSAGGRAGCDDHPASGIRVGHHDAHSRGGVAHRRGHDRDHPDRARVLRLYQFRGAGYRDDDRLGGLGRLRVVRADASRSADGRGDARGTVRRPRGRHRWSCGHHRRWHGCHRRAGVGNRAGAPGHPYGPVRRAVGAGGGHRSPHLAARRARPGGHPPFGMAHSEDHATGAGAARGCRWQAAWVGPMVAHGDPPPLALPWRRACHPHSACHSAVLN